MKEDIAIENKVAKSGLVILEMDQFASTEAIDSLDIRDQLWEGIALKEKDFRAFIAAIDWSAYANKNLAIYCSADAIIPNWAWMLLATHLAPFASRLYFGSPDKFRAELVLEKIAAFDATLYQDVRVIVKGCGDNAMDFSAYGLIAAKLTPVVKSIMFGEPCSTVPVYKRKG